VLVEGHKREDVPPRQALHGLLPGHLSLHGVDEWRELPDFDEAAQHRAGHIGARLV
jgi:hypothetical protein